jgi:hypothetical protein
MQYEVLKQGGEKKYVAPAGGAADNGTRFMVNYRGTLIDGTEFDKVPRGSDISDDSSGDPRFPGGTHQHDGRLQVEDLPSC